MKRTRKRKNGGNRIVNDEWKQFCQYNAIKLLWRTLIAVINRFIGFVWCFCAYCLERFFRIVPNVGSWSFASFQMNRNEGKLQWNMDIAFKNHINKQWNWINDKKGKNKWVEVKNEWPSVAAISKYCWRLFCRTNQCFLVYWMCWCLLKDVEKFICWWWKSKMWESLKCIKEKLFQTTRYPDILY